MSEQPPKPTYDAGHVPMTEEMDSASRSLPPIVPVLIAAVVVGAIVFFIARSTRPVAPATGSIAGVFAVEQGSKQSVLVSVAVTVKNSSDAIIYVKDASVKVTLPDKELTDTPAPAVEVPRYLQAYPSLKHGDAEGMGDNTKIMPEASRDGVFVVVYPVTKDAWDKRKSLEVTINFYDQRPLVLKQ